MKAKIISYYTRYVSTGSTLFGNYATKVNMNTYY